MAFLLLEFFSEMHIMEFVVWGKLTPLLANGLGKLPEAQVRLLISELLSCLLSQYTRATSTSEQRST